MSTEANDPPPLPRRSPKLFPDAPAPSEPAEPPRQVFRLRTEVLQPSEGPSTDKARELFFLNWLAQNPGGKADSEDFERAYGDFQIKQAEAKGYYRDRERTASKWPEIRRALFIGFLILAAIAAFNSIRAKFETRPPSKRSSSSSGGAGADRSVGDRSA